MPKIYSVELADGTLIEGLTLNGNNFVSLVEVDPDIFEDNTSNVTTTEDDGETQVVTEYSEMELVQVTKMENEWWFILRELSEGELKDIKVRSDIDYIAMMSDIELDF